MTSLGERSFSDLSSIDSFLMLLRLPLPKSSTLEKGFEGMDLVTKLKSVMFCFD